MRSTVPRGQYHCARTCQASDILSRERHERLRPLTSMHFILFMAISAGRAISVRLSPSRCRAVTRNSCDTTSHWPIKHHFEPLHSIPIAYGTPRHERCLGSGKPPEVLGASANAFWIEKGRPQRKAVVWTVSPRLSCVLHGIHLGLHLTVPNSLAQSCHPASCRRLVRGFASAATKAAP